MSRSEKALTAKPPEGMASSRPSSSSRTRAMRIGVRETPSRSTSGSSDMRSPGLSSPDRIKSRSFSSARTVCDADRSPLSCTSVSICPVWPADVLPIVWDTFCIQERWCQLLRQTALRERCYGWGQGKPWEERTMATSGLTRRAVLAGMTAAPFAGGARAQTAWPERPVRVMVPYPPAGGADTTARILFGKLSADLGQQFIIENRGGAGGTIGEAIVAKAASDGYTLLHDATAFSVNGSL